MSQRQPGLRKSNSDTQIILQVRVTNNFLAAAYTQEANQDVNSITDNIASHHGFLANTLQPQRPSLRAPRRATSPDARTVQRPEQDIAPTLSNRVFPGTADRGDTLCESAVDRVALPLGTSLPRHLAPPCPPDEALEGRRAYRKTLPYPAIDWKSPGKSKDQTEGGIARGTKMDESNLVVLNAPVVVPTTDVGYLTPGDVITIVVDAAQISHRTLIVMARTDQGEAACLSISHHGGLEPDTNFLSYHCKVTQQGNESARANGTAENGDEQQRATISAFEIRFSKDQVRLLDDCWINCQHIYTVGKVGFRRDGKLHNFKALLKKFRKVQTKMYDAVSDKLAS